MCLRPSSPSDSNSAAVVDDDDDSSSSSSSDTNNKAESSPPPVLKDFSNIVPALHNAVDAIREQHGLPPMVSDASRRGPRRFDVCPDCGGKPTSAVPCPGCGRSVVPGGEARWSGWLPWSAAGAVQGLINLTEY